MTFKRHFKISDQFPNTKLAFQDTCQGTRLFNAVTLTWPKYRVHSVALQDKAGHGHRRRRQVGEKFTRFCSNPSCFYYSGNKCVVWSHPPPNHYFPILEFLRVNFCQAATVKKLLCESLGEYWTQTCEISNNDSETRVQWAFNLLSSWRAFLEALSRKLAIYLT